MSQAAQSDPIFVYGALRSGTTLLQLILNAHPGLFSPCEADFLFDHLSPDPSAPGGWRYDLDTLSASRFFRAAKITLPKGLQGTDLMYSMVQQIGERSPGTVLSVNIHRNAHLLKTFFPDAKVIHLMRDPRDVARSAVKMGWDGNSYHAVRLWIETETTWDAANYPPEQVLSVHFETLMGDLEAELTRICAFMGVAFEPDMLAYHTRSTYEPPDPSIAQKWRENARPRNVALIEGRAGHLMVPRGYALAGEPVTPGALEALFLSLQNRWNRWRYNVRRYGLGLFLKHHVARTLGLKSMAAKTEAQQEAIRVRNMK